MVTCKIKHLQNICKNVLEAAACKNKKFYNIFANFYFTCNHGLTLSSFRSRDIVGRGTTGLTTFGLLYTVSQKNKTQTLVHNFAFDRFSKFFHYYPQQEICNKISLQIPPHLIGVATLLCEILMCENIVRPIWWGSFV